MVTMSLLATAVIVRCHSLKCTLSVSCTFSLPPRGDGGLSSRAAADSSRDGIVADLGPSPSL